MAKRSKKREFIVVHEGMIHKFECRSNAQAHRMLQKKLRINVDFGSCEFIAVKQSSVRTSG